jgi:hypothetical protein
MFYCALHWLDAFFARLPTPVHPQTHGQRNKELSLHPQLTPIYQDYRELVERSRDARYECLAFTDAHVQALRQNELDRIRQHLRPILGI